MTMNENTEEVCPDCKRVVIDEKGYRYCRGFCASVPEDKRCEWHNFKPDDFGIYPCESCKDLIEDEYTPEGYCSSCYPRVRAISRAELHRETLPFIPEEVRARIQKELEE